MSLLEKLNGYFVTEHESIHEFGTDLLSGNAGSIYANNESKLITLLMFLAELEELEDW